MSVTATGVSAEQLTALCRLYLRAPGSCSSLGDTATLTFTPDLTAPEQATFDDLV